MIAARRRMHLALQAAAKSPLAERVADMLGSISPTTVPGARPFNVPKSDKTYFYEGQTAVTTYHGGVERSWDCALLTRGMHPVHATDPEATYELGNATPVEAVSPGCVCLPRGELPRSREVVSPTQRDLGPGMCTGPCAGEAARFPHQLSESWCGPDADATSQTKSCKAKPKSCARGNCSTLGGEAFASHKKLVRRVQERAISVQKH
jgi:hypothetical protein